MLQKNHAFFVIVVGIMVLETCSIGSNSQKNTHANNTNENNYSQNNTNSQDNRNYSQNTVFEISFSQAIAGKMYANLSLLESKMTSLPIHLVVSTEVDSITLTFNNSNPIQAIWNADLKLYKAAIPLETLDLGTYTLKAMAQKETQIVENKAELVVSRSVKQITNYDEVGSANTPRLHWIDDRLYLTWTDRSSDPPSAWMQEIDGAGQKLDEKIRLTGESEAAYYARIAFGGGYLAVLFQDRAHPYTTWFKIVDLQGNTVVPTLELDLDGWYGTFGGDVAYDGTSFVVVWKQKKDILTRIQWLRVNPDSSNIIGPKVIADSGSEDPHGVFIPYSFVEVKINSNISVVVFTREYYYSSWDGCIPRAQVLLVDNDTGSVTQTDFLGKKDDLAYDVEAHLSEIGTDFVALWTSVDLESTENIPPTRIFMKIISSNGELSDNQGSGILLINDPDDRNEPVMIEHPKYLGVLAWTDHRRHSEQPENPYIDVRAAAILETFQVDTSFILEDSLVYAGLAQLQSTRISTNVILVWLDQKHATKPMMQRPEIYFETLWY